MGVLMRHFDMELTGLLVDDLAAAELLTQALAAGQVGCVDDQTLRGIRALDAAMPDDDPDSGWVRMALSLCYTARFGATEDPNDSEPALAAARSLSSFESIPDWFAHYERGRVTYQVGKRLGDPTLLEEAVHFYNRTHELIRPWSPGWQTLRRYRREAIELRHDFAMLAYADTRSAGRGGAQIELPLEAFPATADCRRPSGLRRGVRRAPEPFYCQPAGLQTAAVFWKAEKTRSILTKDEIDERGKRRAGFMNMIEPDQSNLITQTSLVMWLGQSSADEAQRLLRERAPDLYEWGERVSRWADVVTGRVPKRGVQFMTRYLYGTLHFESERRELALNADEPGVLRKLAIRPGKPITRYELSYVLNRLALHEVPVAIEMMQHAQQSMFDDKPRQAVVEAGTAAESALAILYDSHPTTLDVRPKGWSLGRLVRQAHKARLLPNGDTQASLESELVAPRNDAVHRGFVTHSSAAGALEAAQRIVDHTFGTGARDVITLDQRMRELAPLLEPAPRTRAGYEHLFVDEPPTQSD